jgi:hypothetical protein
LPVVQTIRQWNSPASRGNLAIGAPLNEGDSPSAAPQAM